MSRVRRCARSMTRTRSSRSRLRRRVAAGHHWWRPRDGVRRRQVHDLAPLPPPVVTEYPAELKSCPGCGQTAVGDFPAGVSAPTRYGPEITTRVADVVIGHHVPVHRSTVQVMELVGMMVSTGFAASLRGRAADLIVQRRVHRLGAQTAGRRPVVPADETFARAAARPDTCMWRHRAPDPAAHREPFRRDHRRRTGAHRTRVGSWSATGTPGTRI